VIVAVYLFPVYWMVATSLKSAGDIFSSPPSWIPLHPQLAAYSTALIHNSQMLRALGNSAIISLGTMVLTVVLAAPAAYAFARLRLRFAGPAMLLFLIAQLLPSINLALPLFISFSKVGLVDSLFSLVLADTVLALPFAVIILRPFFLRIPSDLEEAAETDGCNRLGVFLSFRWYGRDW
jgi:multiple sugar transport system permease protein